MHQSMYDVVWASNAFTEAECDAILQKYAATAMRPGLLIPKAGDQEVVDTGVRKSSICSVLHDEETKWIFDRLRDIAAMVNQGLKFELKGFDEGLQLARYAEGEFYGWHADLGADVAAFRKLTLVVQLTSPAEYDDGEVEFFPSPVRAPKERGTVAVFPSYVPHRVLPVRRGPRWSLAAWIAGATPFR